MNCGPRWVLVGAITLAATSFGDFQICVRSGPCDCSSPRPDLTTCPGSGTSFSCNGQVTEGQICNVSCTEPVVSSGDLSCFTNSATRTFGGKNSCSGTLVGDPVDVAIGTGVVDRRDLSIAAPAGQLEVWRTLSTNRLQWFGSSAQPLKNKPKLFGEALSSEAPYWKLNWTAFVQNTDSVLVVWASDGSVQTFAWDAQCASQQSLPVSLAAANGAKVASELFCLSSSEFILLRADGVRERFANPYDGSLDKLTFLTEVLNERGNVLASVSYAPPRDSGGTLLSGCPGVGFASTPYISSVSSASAYVEFRYTTRGTGASQVCPVAQLRAGASSSSATLAVGYGYQPASTASVAPLRSATQYVSGSPTRTEAYSNMPYDFFGADGGARTFQGTENVAGDELAALRTTYAFTIPSGGVLVTQEASPTESLTIGSTNPHAVTQLQLPNGDLPDTSTSLTESHLLTQSSAWQALRRSTKQVSCGASQSCYAGTETWAESSIGTSDYAFTVTPAYGQAQVTGSAAAPLQVDGGAPQSWLTASSHAGVDAGTVLTGLNTPGNCKGLECEWYGWTRVATNQVKLATTTRPSVVQAGQFASTTRAYYPNGELKSVIESGLTKREQGTGPVVPDQQSVMRHVGTFYLTSRTPAGSCLGGSDPLGRVVEVHGPCDVAGTSATDCSGTSFPIVQYFFYDATVPQVADRLRLSEVRRLPRGCSGVPPLNPPIALSVQYSNYDAFGRPGSVLDENLVTTNFTFDADGHVLTRTTAGSTWTFRYVSGRLRSVKYPEGHVYRYCYLPSPSFSASSVYDCTEGAALELDRPTLVVKARQETGTTEWSEAVLYDVHPTTKSVTAARYYSRGESTPRRQVAFGNDAQGRLTSLREGGSSGSVMRQRFLDGELLGAIGPAFNSPPAFCWDPVTQKVSTKCTEFSYDGARRLTGAWTTLATGSSPEMKLAHDGNGNLCDEVVGSLGATPAASCDATTARGDVQSTSYEYDDFGNVLAAWTLGAVNGTGKGGVQFRYDALGNVTLRQTTQQAIDGASTLFQYDFIGRRTGVLSSTAAQPQQYLYVFVYDTNVPACSMSQANMLGRLASTGGPLGTTYYSYDAFGHVGWERLLRSSGQCTGTTDTSPQTSYTWTPSGFPVYVTYPHGLVVQYQYEPTANERKDRVVSVWVSTDGIGMRALLTNITWEPFGGLRYYNINATAGGVAVERVLGDTTVAPPANDTSLYCPAMATVASNSTQTGRPAGLFVSTTTLPQGSGSGDVFKLRYTWTADQLTQTTSCLLNSVANTQLQTFQYDRALRLTRSDYPRMQTSGGPHIGDVFTLDARGNRLANDISGYGHIFNYTYPTPQAPDRVGEVTASNPGSLNRRSYAYDADGRVTSITWPVDTSGQPSKRYVFGYLAGGGAADSAVKQAALTTGSQALTYDYVYDDANRRRAKLYPSGNRDEYFWRNGSELLEDRGWRSDGYTADEYVWLDGKPVAMRRSRFNASWARQPETTAECARAGESTTTAFGCGWRYLVNDETGRVVLAMDEQKRIAGTYEYHSYGHANRMNWWGDTSHPYGNLANQLIATPEQPARGLQEDMRFKWAVFDVETFADYVRAYDTTTWVVKAEYTGNHGYQLTTPWLTGSKFGLYLQTNASNVYTGAALETTEYRRYATGAAPLTLRLRLAGQYWDEETDLFENWNRYYDPMTGGYLSPEPLLQSPAYVTTTASRGMQVPTYAYAANNPLRYVDPDGLEVRSINFAAYLALTECLPRFLADPVIGGEFARLMMDPNNIAYLNVPGPGGLVDFGGGLTGTRSRRGSGAGYANTSQACQEDATAFHQKYGTNRPPLNFQQSDFCGLIAHELGHQFEGFYGAGETALRWENALRALQGLPPRTSHATPSHPFSPAR